MDTTVAGLVGGNYKMSDKIYGQTGDLTVDDMEDYEFFSVQEGISPPFVMPKDFTGREIQVNNIIVYPGRHGSSLWMNMARVNMIEWSNNRVRLQVERSSGAKTWITRLERCTVIGHVAGRNPIV